MAQGYASDVYGASRVKTARPGEYCFVNGHWVLVPPLYRIAAEYASANQRPGK